MCIRVMKAIKVIGKDEGDVGAAFARYKIFSSFHRTFVISNVSLFL